MSIPATPVRRSLDTDRRRTPAVHALDLRRREPLPLPLRAPRRGRRCMKAREPFPIVYARDVHRSAAFYRDAFGFEESFRWPDDGPAKFVFLRLEPLGIGVRRWKSPGERAVPTSPIRTGTHSTWR